MREALLRLYYGAIKAPLRLLKALEGYLRRSALSCAAGCSAGEGDGSS